MAVSKTVVQAVIELVVAFGGEDELGTIGARGTDDCEAVYRLQSDAA
jgi:hypothetical protein